MIAISTIHMILQHKQKYSPIGQANPGSINDPEGAKLALLITKQFGELADKIFPKINALMSEFDGKISVSNVGASVMTKQFETLSGTIQDTIKQMTFLEQREASLTSTFKTGTQVLALRTKAFTTLQKSISATNDQMAQYRSSLEAPSGGLSGQLFAKIAESAEYAGKVAAKVAAGTATEAEKAESAKLATAQNYLDNQVKAFHYLSQNTNLTAEQQSSFNLYAAGTNKTLAEQVAATQAVADAVGSAIDPATAFSIITEDIAGMSSDLRQQYNKIPGSLEVAVLKSKQLGVSMDQLNKTGKGLLNIEESVGKEIEYQLITGKRLLDTRGNSITQQYREATLMGDAKKQAQLMQQVYITQNDVLEKGNVLQKEALAETLHMSTQDLMNMYEKQKVQDKINEKLGIGAAEYAEILDSPELEKSYNLKVQELAGNDKETADALNLLNKKDAAAKGPATVWYEKALSVWDTGLNVKITGGGLKEARAQGKSYGDQMVGLNKFQQEQGLQDQLGKMQLKANAGTTIATAIKGISDGIPLLGTALSKFTDLIKAFNEKFLYGSKMEGSKKETTAGQKQQDAVVGINDGVIQFNENDKLTVVASPYGTMNEKVADKIVGAQAPNNSSVDTNAIVAAIQQGLSSTNNSSVDTNAIVGAIQKAMGNISITVAVDPMAIDKEIKFRQGSLNT